MLKTIALLKTLERYPVFNISTFKSLTKYGENYARLVLHRLTEKGLVIRIERNKYTVHKDPLLIASHIVWPAYISMWGSIRYYNLTDQIVSIISVITPREKNNIEFCGTKIRFFKIGGDKFTGYKKENYNGTEIFVAEPEKAIADALFFKMMSPKEAEELSKKLNKGKLNKYKTLLGVK